MVPSRVLMGVPFPKSAMTGDMALMNYEAKVCRICSYRICWTLMMTMLSRASSLLCSAKSLLAKRGHDEHEGPAVAKL